MRGGVRRELGAVLDRGRGSGSGRLSRLAPLGGTEQHFPLSNLVLPALLLASRSDRIYYCSGLAGSVRSGLSELQEFRASRETNWETSYYPVLRECGLR